MPYSNYNKIDFIGVGAAKSGTTWLASILNSSSQIFIPDEKELHFFNSKEGLGGKYEFIPINFNKGLNRYFEKFSKAKANQKKGEISVFYLCDPEAPKLIHKYLGNVKIIIMLRNPVSRLFSYHLWRNPSHNGDSFTDFLKDSNMKEIVNSSFYYQDVKRYIDTFGKSNVFVGIFEEAMSDKIEFASNLCNFLEIKNNIQLSELVKKVNPTYSVRGTMKRYTYKVVSRTVQILNKSFIGKRLYNILLDLKLNKIIYYGLINNKQKSKINISDSSYLNNIFKKDVQNLSALLNKDLGRLWGIK